MTPLWFEMLKICGGSKGAQGVDSSNTPSLLARNRHLPMVGLPTVTGQAAEIRTWWILSSVRVYSLATVEWSEFLPGPSLCLLERGRNNTSYLFWCLYCGNYISITGTPALRSFIHVDVGEPTRYPCSMTGMMQDHHLLQLWITWDIYLRELLCHREEVLSGMRISFLKA